MVTRLQGIVTAVGALLLIGSLAYYASVWSDNAKNKEMYNLYLAGRLTGVTLSARETMVNAKLALDRAKFAGGGLALMGVLAVGLGLYRPIWVRSQKAVNVLYSQVKPQPSGPIEENGSKGSSSTDSLRKNFLWGFWSLYAFSGLFRSSPHQRASPRKLSVDGLPFLLWVRSSGYSFPDGSYWRLWGGRGGKCSLL